MNRKLGAIAAIAVIIAFAAFIIYDIATGNLFTDKPVTETGENIEYPAPAWQVDRKIMFPEAKLWAITVTADDRLVAAGSGFITLYDTEFNAVWTAPHEAEITALATHGEIIYAATEKTILLFSLNDGSPLTEWGPWEDNSLITSISATGDRVAFADAGMRRVYILNSEGSMLSFFGHEGETFIIPSGYFDLHLPGDNFIRVVNPGKLRLELRDFSGKIISSFGEPGLAPEAFSGCCNPSHFAMLGDSLVVTSEKGISRIKIMTTGGALKEFVAVPGLFTSALPLDLATDRRGRIFAASTYESAIYVFTRNM